jgi:GAF domain-containing protein
VVDHAALRVAFQDFARAVLGPYDADRMLHLLTGQVVEVLGVDGAGVSLATVDEQLRFVTATDDEVATVEDAQVSLNEGPCHEAYRIGQPVAVTHLELEARWPGYRRTALALGMRSVAGIPMPAAGRRIGALNLYRKRSHTWDTAELETAQLLADMATGYILNSSRLHHIEEQWRANLDRALEGRDIIGQAKGILRARHGLTAEGAFELLRRTSQHHNVKLRQIAAQVVETGELRSDP